MKKFNFTLIIALLTCSAITSAFSQNKPRPSKPLLIMQNDTQLLRHIVLLKFKDSATPEQVKEVERAFSALPDKIRTIVGYEWGTNISPENLAQGFTHAFLVSFKNTADRDAYLPHPAHKAFVDVLLPHMDKALVVDFIGQK